MIPSDRAVDAAWRALRQGDPLDRILRETYHAGYHEGDLDRQRIERATVKTPQRKPRRKP